MANPFNVFCPEGSTIETDTSYDAEDAETNVWLLCSNAQGEVTKDVTAHVVFSSVGIFLCLLFVFIGLTLRKGFKQMAPALKMASNAMSQGQQASAGEPIIKINGRIVSSPVQNQGASKPQAKQRLQQLQEAFDAGLITQSEFENKRQQILDEL